MSNFPPNKMGQVGEKPSCGFMEEGFSSNKHNKIYTLNEKIPSWTYFSLLNKSALVRILIMLIYSDIHVSIEMTTYKWYPIFHVLWRIKNMQTTYWFQYNTVPTLTIKIRELTSHSSLTSQVHAYSKYCFLP